MIHHVKGDLLESDCQVIMHQANANAVMGAGIAKQIAKTFPAVLQADRDFPIPVGSRDRLGKFSYARDGDRFVINLYGQHRYGNGRHTEPEAVKKALCRVMECLNKDGRGDYKIGVPHGMGCGLAGGDWVEEIQPILHRVSDYYNQDIYVYAL